MVSMVTGWMARLGASTIETSSLEVMIEDVKKLLSEKSGSPSLAQQVHECIPLILSLAVLFCDKKPKHQLLYDLICGQEELFIVSEERPYDDIIVTGRREDGTAVLDMRGLIQCRYSSTDGRAVCTRKDEHHGVFAVYIEYIILKGLLNLANRVTRLEGMTDAQYAAALFSLFHAKIVEFVEEYSRRQEKDLPQYCQTFVGAVFHELFPGGEQEWNLPRILNWVNGSLYQQIVREVVPDILVQALGTIQKMLAVIPLQNKQTYREHPELAEFAHGLAEGGVHLSPQIVTQDPWITVQGYDWSFLNDFLREVVKDTKAMQFKEMLIQLLKRGLFSVLLTVPGLGQQLMHRDNKKAASETLFALIFEGVLTGGTLEPLSAKLKDEQKRALPDGLDATLMDLIITLLEKRVIELVKNIEATISSLKKRTRQAYKKLWEKHPSTADSVTPFIRQVGQKVAVLVTPKLETLLKDEDTRKQLISRYLPGCTPDTAAKLSQFIGDIINSSNFQQILCEQLEYIIIHILLALWESPREEAAHPAKTLLEKGSEIFLRYLPQLQDAFKAVNGKDEDAIISAFVPIMERLCAEVGVTQKLFKIEKEGDDELTKKVGTFLYSLVLRQGAIEFAYRYMQDMKTPLDRAEKDLSDKLCGNRTLPGSDEKSGLQKTARGIVDYLLNVVLQREATVDQVMNRALDVCGPTDQRKQAATFLSHGGIQQFCKDSHQRSFVETIDRYVFRLLSLASSRFLRESPHLGHRVAVFTNNHAGTLEVVETRVKEPAAYFQIITFIFHKVVRNWVFAIPRPAARDQATFYQDVATRVWTKVTNKHPDDQFSLPLSSEWQDVAKKAWEELGPQLIQDLIQPYIDPVGRIKLLLNGIGSFAELPYDREIAHLKSSSTDIAGAKKLLKRQMRRATREVIKNYLKTQYRELEKKFEVWVEENPRLELIGKAKKIIVDTLFVYLYRYVLSYVIRYLVLPLLQFLLLPVTLVEGYVLSKLVDWLSGKEWERAYQDVILSLFDEVISPDFSNKWKEMANGQEAHSIFKQDFDDTVAYFIDHEMGGMMAWPIKYGLKQIFRRVEVVSNLERDLHKKSPLEDMVLKLNRAFV